MRSKVLIVRQWRPYVSSELVIYLFPCVVNLLAQMLLVGFVANFIGIKRCEINQSVFEKLQICELFSTIVHCFKRYKNIVVIVYLMNVEH